MTIAQLLRTQRLIDWMNAEHRRMKIIHMSQEAIQYGHRFGKNRVCECGLSLLDYHAHPERRSLCTVR